MSEGHLKFRLEGEVTIGTLTEACLRFSKVLQALGESHEASVEWMLAELDHGSAAVTARALPLDDQATQLIPRMAEDYVQAASVLASSSTAQSHNPPDPAVLDRVRHLAEMADEKSQITLEAAARQITFTPSILHSMAVPSSKTTSSLGTIRGQIETLSRRKGLRFYLNELTTDKSVRCNPPADLERTMRGVWGRVADVTGTITPDAATGQPISIRDITEVQAIEEGDPLGYLQARGALQTSEPAELAVRRIRDAVPLTAPNLRRRVRAARLCQQ